MTTIVRMIQRLPWRSMHFRIALLAALAIAIHLLLVGWGVQASRSGTEGSGTQGSDPRSWPLLVALAIGGTALVAELAWGAIHGKFGADLLAAVSIVTSVLLGEYLAGTIVVLMLSGGQSLEEYAVRSASSVLEALARRMPTLVHRKRGESIEEVAVEKIVPGDRLLVYPHEICPVDGTVTAGHGSMDESYLSGEPYQVSKSVGSQCLSGAINGAAVLELEATRPAADSRYSRIMRVMQESAQQRPTIRRLGDQLGTLYTPLALAVALLAWWASGEPRRFLAVLVVATPCPLLIAIPVAVIGAISLAARRGIIIKDPAILERLKMVRTAMFDKTGTLTYGRPAVTGIVATQGQSPETILRLAANLEQYSKHPLSGAVLEAAKAAHLPLMPCEEVHEDPGQGLRGRCQGTNVVVTSRKAIASIDPESPSKLPAKAPGMECVVAIDGRYAGLLQFRDQPRPDGHSFISHLKPLHGIDRILLISGDREEEVRDLATKMGIDEVHASQSPEQKLEIVRQLTSQGDSLYLGDGINDAPALAAATIGIAMGSGSEITSEAADAVILDSSLSKVDELLHIGNRMRRIALQSAVGGMLLSLGGMVLAAAGWLAPVAGAIVQEAIDVIAVLNALRASSLPKELTDYQSSAAFPDSASNPS
ncbi:MAG: heavy metal translocating P-type ATPase [Pirellulaceae bacterium]